jgi:predicted DNA-binding protein YlxM (UPF0122 family)
MPAQRGVTPRRITEDDYELFRELYAQNLGRNEIARQMGISTGSVTNIARRQGVRFDTTETELAVESMRQQAAEARARLSLKMLRMAESLLEQVYEPATIGNFGGRNNTWSQVELDQPTDTAKRNLVQSAGVLLDRSLRLEEFDQHTGDEQVIGMLDGLELTIRRAAKELEDDSASDDPPGD